MPLLPLLIFQIQIQIQRTELLLSFKNVEAAFKNTAGGEVENRASVCAGWNPNGGNRNAAEFCGCNRDS
ncbi:hypothetical protein GCM10011328_28400 [Hafnia psychrotolerans]|uniref:Uncharacterized protein n=1 Tax=Hafnia psychrotolerans TaxID=1477018 RepID=A0ABQ1GW50_9GAMM|nr:hypothetical protein GCM10011328_28400 [Hafnia psychrotolerans]